jgi:hypothetical protein
LTYDLTKVTTMFTGEYVWVVQMYSRTDPEYSQLQRVYQSESAAQQFTDKENADAKETGLYFEYERRILFS